ncbi:hypothetical protein A3K72_03145 [Candidatus Woesearchaeota archaeon RBG_13_36_6]|nr:MAG: hypothetical protein A3K72_03145 [Candidatus Woesearchaeota archaeon RBG_13_36_6]
MSDKTTGTQSFAQCLEDIISPRIIDLKRLRTRFHRFKEHWVEGPQRFEGLVNEILQEEYDRGTLSGGYNPVYVLNFGEGLYPDHIDHIYLCQLSIDAEKIFNLFKKGHTVRVAGTYSAGDITGKFESGPNLGIISAFLASFVATLGFRDICYARITVEDRSSGKPLMTHDVRFKYVYPPALIKSTEYYDCLLTAFPADQRLGGFMGMLRESLPGL